jgi:hypothetical protein
MREREKNFIQSISRKNLRERQLGGAKLKREDNIEMNIK